MKTRRQYSVFSVQRSVFSAFTLIELLVVIAIIALLAAMLLPVGAAVKRAQMRKMAEGSLALVVSAIETYHAKTGTYPPADSTTNNVPNPPVVNPLFYELCGTTLDNTGLYTTKDGSAKIQDSNLPTTFGTNVAGFMNSTKGGAGDEARNAENFLKAGVKAGTQYKVVNNPSGTPAQITVLGLPIDGPNALTALDGSKFSPWCYNMSTPTNNPTTYDLWIDLKIGAETNRISNWSQKPQKL